VRQHCQTGETGSDDHAVEVFGHDRDGTPWAAPRTRFCVSDGDASVGCVPCCRDAVAAYPPVYGGAGETE
jgi:hypothetical protein